jgi:L-ascorbate metabolism protein UlaG (beta-lactamase superfamily)
MIFLKVVVVCFLGFIALVAMVAYGINRFLLTGSVYTGTSAHLVDGRFVMPGIEIRDKDWRDMWEWRKQQSESVAWNEPYGTGTISYEPLVASTSVRATFINHATVLLESASTTIITDPIFSRRASPFSFSGPSRHHDPYLPLHNIPKLDYVVISHAHYDHLSVPSIRMIEERFAPTYIVPKNNAQFILRANVPSSRIIELDVFETRNFEERGLSLTLERAKHWAMRGIGDRNRYLWGSFVISLLDVRIYFAGDTGYDTHFADIGEKYGPFDLALLPIGAYAPRWFMKDAHMNPEEAVQAAADLKSTQAMGIHFGTFKLTDEGRHDPERDTKNALASSTFSGTFLVPTLENGLTLTVWKSR